MPILTSLRRSAVVLSLCGGALTAAGCSHHVHPHHHGAGDAQTNVATVVGVGKISRKPDIARATVGVEVMAPTVAEATRRSNERMTTLVNALKGAGIADGDIQTSNYSIHFERTHDHPPPPFAAPAPPDASPPPPPRSAPGKKGSDAAPVAPAAAPAVPSPAPAMGPAGLYRVTNTVALTIRDLSRLGPALDTAVAQGANSVWGVSFALDKPEALEAEARLAAVEDARKRAEALAKAEGKKLGPLVSVSDAMIGGIGPHPTFAMKADAMGPPIESGEVQIVAQVHAVYRLLDHE